MHVSVTAARASAPAAQGGGSTADAAAAATSRPAVGEVLELTCSDLAFGGEGVCRLPGGMVCFVQGALPGERLTARVTQAKKSFCKAAKVGTLQPHDDAVEPVCQHFGPCGGCTLQNLRYDAQLAAKHRQVADLMVRTAGIAEADLAAALRPPVGCSAGQQYSYRNRMEFSFSTEAWEPAGQGACSSAGGAADSGFGGSGGGGGGFALGLHKPGCDTAVLPISRCHLQSDAANALLARVADLCRQAGLQAHDPATGQGLLQHLVIRRASGGSQSSSCSGGSSSSGGGSDEALDNVSAEEYLLNIVTADDGRAALAPLAAALMREPLPAPPSAAAPSGSSSSGGGSGAAAPAALAPPPPRLVGVVNSVSQQGRPAGERRLAGEHVLAGRGRLVERLCGLELEVSANSFFQTNTRQAEVLYGLVASAAELRPADVLLDLYCGAGSIALSLAGACAQVYGVEISEAAVADARRNAQRNGIANAAFLQGDLHKLRLEGRLPRPDVVVVDPARPGLSPAVVQYLRSCGARRVVYVSCNASTQARDLRLLCATPGAAPVAAAASGGAEARGGGGNSRSRGGRRGSRGKSSRRSNDSTSISSGDSGDSGSGAVERRFRLASLQACDLFPQTWHVETVAVLDAVA